MLGLHILWILLLLLPSNLNSNIASDGGRLSLPGTRAGSCAMARVTHLLLRLAWSWQYSASTNARWHKLPQSQSEFKFWLQASVAPLYGLGLWPHYVTRLSPGPACRAWRQGGAARRAGMPGMAPRERSTPGRPRRSPWLEPQIYTARCKVSVFCDHGKGCRGRHQHTILCEGISIPEGRPSHGPGAVTGLSKFQWMSSQFGCCPSRHSAHRIVKSHYLALYHWCSMYLERISKSLDPKICRSFRHVNVKSTKPYLMLQRLYRQIAIHSIDTKTL